MTTFQAIVYAIIHGITEFLPISSKTHHILIPYLTGWQAPSGAFLGALALGSFLAVMIYFRHDWASMISSGLQVVLFRRRPMSVDERMPLFLGVTLIPTAFAMYTFHEEMIGSTWPPLWVAGAFALWALPLWFFDSISRKSKGVFDWKWVDAIVVGLAQAMAVLPGCDPITGILIGALFLNYKREPAVKYAFYASAPILLARTVSHLKGLSFGAATPMPDLSWLSFGVAVIVTLLVSLLMIGGFLKHVQQKGFGQYVLYRLVFAAGVCTVYWVRTRG